MPNIKTLESILWLKTLVDTTLKSVIKLVTNWNPHSLPKAPVAIGLFALIGFTMLMNAMETAEAASQEDHFYDEVQAAVHFQLEPLPLNATDREKTARDEQYQQNWNHGLELCEKFLRTYPESERHDAVTYKKLIFLRNLKRDSEFDDGVEAFIAEQPYSKYTDKLHRHRAYELESQFKFEEALSEWDKIDAPALLHEVYDRKGQIYSEMGNWRKRLEYDLRRAELILGKPAPEFSHTNVDGGAVSLAGLRGKVVVLYFWSMRDGRTVRDDETGGEISILKRLHDLHGENPNFVLITICLQNAEAKLKEFIRAHAMPGIHLLLKYEAVPYQFGVIGWPHYTVLDKAGILRHSEFSSMFEDLPVEYLVASLLAEDLDVPGERIIPRIIQSRGEIYEGEGQVEKAIAEYEDILSFTPSNIHLIMRTLNLKLEQTDAPTRIMNRAHDRIVELSQLPQYREFGIRDLAVELAQLFSELGNQEKTWTLFQIAVAHDTDNDLINWARRNPKDFRAIQDMSEFHELLADTPQSEAEKRLEEGDRKVKLYAEDLIAAHKSFTAVDADGEIFTGVILSQVGHILVPGSVTEAMKILAKIDDYQPANVVAIDTESGFGVIQVVGQKYLRPVVLGAVDDLKEFAPIPLPNVPDGYSYATAPAITVRGSFENNPDAVGRPINQDATVIQLEIHDDEDVTALKVANLGRLGGIMRGDALVYYDGRLLAVSLEDELRYERWGSTSAPIPIDQIRVALERMDMIDLMEHRIGKPAKEFELVIEAEEFTRLDGTKADVHPFIIKNDRRASGGAFIVANRALDHQYQIPNSWLTYEIEIPADGDYAIWIYARKYTVRSDSFFVGTDLELPRTCEVDSFKWSAVPAIDRTSPQVVPAFHFTQGVHEIRLFVRETGTELDAILITNNLSLDVVDLSLGATLEKYQKLFLIKNW